MKFINARTRNGKPLGIYNFLGTPYYTGIRYSANKIVNNKYFIRRQSVKYSKMRINARDDDDGLLYAIVYFTISSLVLHKEKKENVL